MHYENQNDTGRKNKSYVVGTDGEEDVCLLDSCMISLNLFIIRSDGLD